MTKKQEKVEKTKKEATKKETAKKTTQKTKPEILSWRQFSLHSLLILHPP